MHQRFQFVLPVNKASTVKPEVQYPNIFSDAFGIEETVSVSPDTADRLQRARDRIALLRNAAAQQRAAQAHQQARLAQIRGRIQVTRQACPKAVQQGPLTDLAVQFPDTKPAEQTVASKRVPDLRVIRNALYGEHAKPIRDVIAPKDQTAPAKGKKLMLHMTLLALTYGHLLLRGPGA